MITKSAHNHSNAFDYLKAITPDVGTWESVPQTHFTIDHSFMLTLLYQLTLAT